MSNSNRRTPLITSQKSSLITSFFTRINEKRDICSNDPYKRSSAAEERLNIVVPSAATLSREPPVSVSASSNHRPCGSLEQKVPDPQECFTAIAAMTTIGNRSKSHPIENPCVSHCKENGYAASSSESIVVESNTLDIINNKKTERTTTRPEPLSNKRQRKVGSSFSAPVSETNSEQALMQPSHNIVHKLACRSLIGMSRRRFSSTLWCDKFRRAMHWKIASTLRIPVRAASNNRIDASSLLAFDSDGSLLALAHGRAEISVFDWQSVRLTARRKKNVTTSDLVDCLPILHFKVGPFSIPIVLLAWNPFKEDEIVVGLRATGSVFILDLQVVQGWLEDQPPYGSASMPPCSELRCFETGPRDLPACVGCSALNRSSCFVFLDEGRVALLSAGATVFCWRLPPRESSLGARTSTIWRYQNSEIVSVMSILSAETVVLGGETGSITILNWKKTQCNAFFSKPTPTIWARFDWPDTGKVDKVRTVRLTAVKKLTNNFFRLIWLSQNEQVTALTVCLETKSLAFEKPQVSANGKNLSLVQVSALFDKEIFLWNTFHMLVHNSEVAEENRNVHDDRILRRERDGITYTRGQPLLKCWVVDGQRSYCQSIPDEIGSIKSMAVHPNAEYLVLGTSSNTLVVLADRA